MRERGSVLVALLWCMALLSLLVIGVLHSSRMSLMSVRHHGDAVQARYLALAGVEKAKALLYQDARQRSRSAQSHGRALADAPDQFQDIPLGRGRYSVVRAARADEGGGMVYGVTDEESRLNVNVASAEELLRLEGMTSDVVAAILDWRDGDQSPGPGGAEADYYAVGRNPVRIRDGPLETIRELLMVRGVRLGDLFGDDTQGTGFREVDSGEGEGEGDSEPIRQPAADRGWAGSLTVRSAVANVSASGRSRVNLKTADESALTGVRGITAEIAKAIVAHRGRGSLDSVADLLEVRQAPAAGPGQGGPGGPEGNPGAEAPRPGGPPENNGPKVIDANLLRDIADEVTASDEEELVGVVNINSAGLEVLRCLPGMTRELAQALISYRSSNGSLPNIAHLLLVPGVTEETFKQLAPRVTARSETHRILGEGRMPGTGAVRRVEVMVRVTGSEVRTVAYREDDL